MKIKVLAEAGVPLARIDELLSAAPDRFTAAITEIGRTIEKRARDLVRTRERLTQLETGDRLFVSADETAKSAISTGASATTGAAAASSSVDVKADTDRICKNVVAAFDSEKLQLLEAMLILASEEDKAAQAKARTDATAVIERLKTVVDKETANATDPKVKAALQQLIATFGNIIIPEFLADPDFEKNMDEAMAEAAAYCPGLNA